MNTRSSSGSGDLYSSFAHVLRVIQMKKKFVPMLREILELPEFFSEPFLTPGCHCHVILRY